MPLFDCFSVLEGLCICYDYPPIGVNNLAEGQLTAHAEIGLVVWEYRGWYPHWIHFTIFL